MNINAKQLSGLDCSRMDITTSLSFFMQMKNKLSTETTLTATMASVWTAFSSALTAFDDAYAQARKWQQTADIVELDNARDAALSAFLNALKAMQASPNATKQQAAKHLLFIRDKYSLSVNDEYMKETTAIAQMIQEMEADAQAPAALSSTGLDDWLTDLKTKNAAFLAKMNERTEAQAGQQKGIVRETRLALEARYRDVVKLINALAIVEIPAGFNYATIIDRLNAEIEHYRQILARKGSGGGSSSGSSSGNVGTTTTPETPGGSGSGDSSTTPPDSSGGDNGEGLDMGGSTTPPDTGGDNNSGDNGGDNGSGDNPYGPNGEGLDMG